MDMKSQQRYRNVETDACASVQLRKEAKTDYVSNLLLPSSKEGDCRST